MFTTSQQRKADASIDASKKKFITLEKRYNSNNKFPSELKIIGDLPHNHQKVVMMFSLFVHFAIGDGAMETWKKHHCRARTRTQWWESYRTLGLGLADHYPGIGRLLEEAGRYLLQNQKNKDTPRFIDVYEALKTAEKDCFVDCRKYLASHWDDSVDPLQLPASAANVTVVQKQTYAKKQPHFPTLQISKSVQAKTDPNRIFFNPSTDSLDDLASRSVSAAWIRGYAFTYCQRLWELRFKQPVEFFYKIHQYIPYEWITSETKLKKQIPTFAGYQAVVGNPLLDEAGHLHPFCIITPQRSHIVADLAEDEDFVDVRPCNTSSKAILSKIQSALWSNKTGFILHETQLASTKVAELIVHVVETEYLVYIVGTDATLPAIAKASNDFIYDVLMQKLVIIQ